MGVRGGGGGMGRRGVGGGGMGVRGVPGSLAQEAARGGSALVVAAVHHRSDGEGGLLCVVVAAHGGVCVCEGVGEWGGELVGVTRSLAHSFTRC